MNEFMYPTTFDEQNIAEGIDQILPEHIASYAWPPGRRERYTDEGWERAKRRGFAQLRPEDYGALGDGIPHT